MDAQVVVDVVGWAGALALVGAYALVSTGRLRGRSARFQVLNVFGSIALAVNTVYYGAWPSTALNVVWLVVGVVTLVRITGRHYPEEGSPP